MLMRKQATGAGTPDVTKNRIAILCGLAFLLVAGDVAYAQSPPVIEQITVTARKRQQDPESVDISLSVASAETLRKLHVELLPEVAALAENVEIFEDFPGAGIPTWIIRGVGLQDFNSNNTPAAGIYLDDSYQVATVMGGTSLFDIEQVEVLKGPQGGLYGRNASGGAVLLKTRRPDHGERNGFVRVGYGSWQRSAVEGAINLPLARHTDWRVSGKTQISNDGWQSSVAGGKRHGEEDRYDLRSWLLMEPAAAIKIAWKVQVGKDSSEIPLGRSIGLYAKNATGDICAPMLAGRRDDDECINFGGVNRLYRADGETPELISRQSKDGSKVFSDSINRQMNDYTNSVLDISLSMGFAEFRSITSYDDFSYGVALDLDGSAGEYGHRFSNSNIRVAGQEFRLLSSGKAGLQWLLGVVFSAEDFEERRDFRLGDNSLVPLGRGKLEYDQDTASSAAYADLEYAVSRNVGINGNLRYTRENKEYRNGNFFIPLAPPVYLNRDLKADYKLDDRLSGSVALDWTPTENSLNYVKFSQGFKSGGFYGGFPFQAEEILPYREERIAAAEMGIKQHFPDYAVQVNASIFHYDFRGVQGFVQEINTLTKTGVDRLTNQGDAVHDGMELQMTWNLRSALELDIGLSWLDARFVSRGKTTTNLLGQQVEISGQRPYAPTWGGNLMLDYLQPLSSDLMLGWTLAYDYRTDFAGEQSTLAEKALNALPGYGVLNGTVNLMRSGLGWKGGFWVHNALDRVYRTRVKGDGLNSYMEMFGERRAMGLVLDYQF